MAKDQFIIEYRAPWEMNMTLNDGTLISSSVSAGESDALLCDWAPDNRLLDYDKPAIWYNCEPFWSYEANPDGHHNRMRLLVPEHRFINHRTADSALRTPHVTHLTEPNVVDSPSRRLQKAVAVVSNSQGGGKSHLTCRTEIRNAIITHRDVDLFGRRDSWSKFRKTIFGQLRPPRNYKGEVASGDHVWHSTPKRELLAQYHANVCMENAVEENYFTEKFIEAVICGCVPIYHAHESVKDTFLHGAAWVDPKSFNFDPAETIRAALLEDRQLIARKNVTWLQTNSFVKQTRIHAVLTRLANILKQQIEEKH
jgi:hypothetical protein